MKALLIAEKASLAKAVQSAYRNNQFKDQIDFFALHGHIMALKDPGEYNPDWQVWSYDSLPLLPENFDYKVADHNLYDQLVNILKNGNYDYLINCCDPDREGQHIFYSIYDSLNINLPVYRMWHNDLSETELMRALNNMDDDLNTAFLVNLKTASKLRAQFDWLVGMNASRIVTLKRRSVTRLGRVMSPTFKILADRELAIKKFAANTSYSIEANVADSFKARLVKLTDNKYETINFTDKLAANAYLKNLANHGTVIEYESKDNYETADQLPSLADIQALANKTYGFTLDKTLNIVQSLYEKKLVSYPRTDCCYVTKAVAKDFPKILNSLKPTKSLGPFVNKITNEDILKTTSDKNYVNDSKVTAHYALIPTGNLKASFSEEEKQIFELICKRFVAIFLPPCITKRSKIIIKVNDDYLQANGSTLIQKGYKALMGYDKKDESLPEVKVNDVLTISKYSVNEHTSKAPSRFTDASLLNAMINAANYIEDGELSEVLKGDGNVKDSGGIGTPATRAAIVEKLVQPITNKDGKTYWLAYRKGKYFYVSEEGLDLMESLKDFDITSPILTAIWEKKLKEIEEGQLTVETFKTEMIDYIKEVSNQMLESSFARVVGSYLKANCPICHSRMKVMNNYYICEKYNKENGCSFIIPKIINNANISERQVMEICEGKQTKPIRMKSNKTGKDFLASLSFNNETKNIEFNFEAMKNNTLLCPECGKKVTATKNYYMCESYNNGCSFIVNKEINGAKITESNIADICSGKITKPLKMKSNKTGNSYYATLQYNKENKHLDLQLSEHVNDKLVCPYCNGKIKATNKYYICENYRGENNCNFIVPLIFNQAKISEKDVVDICLGKTTKALKMTSGKTGNNYYAALTYNKETNKIDLVFDQGQSTKYHCPNCDSLLIKKITNNEEYLICPNNDFTTTYVFSGKKLKETEMKQLLENKELKCEGFISAKTGKTFNSKLIIEDGKIKFYFGKKKDS